VLVIEARQAAGETTQAPTRPLLPVTHTCFEFAVTAALAVISEDFRWQQDFQFFFVSHLTRSGHRYTFA